MGAETGWGSATGCRRVQHGHGRGRLAAGAPDRKTGGDAGRGAAGAAPAPGPGALEPADIWLGQAGDAPFAAVLDAWLHPGTLDVRCAIAAAVDDAAAGMIASALLRDPALVHERLIVRSGDPDTDRLIADLAPALVALVRHLTSRQREVGRLLLVDGLRRAEIAERLGISRPTVSVMVDRARLVEIRRMVAAMSGLFRAGADRAACGVAGATARGRRPVPDGAQPARRTRAPRGLGAGRSLREARFRDRRILAGALAGYAIAIPVGAIVAPASGDPARPPAGQRPRVLTSGRRWPAVRPRRPARLPGSRGRWRR